MEKKLTGLTNGMVRDSMKREESVMLLEFCCA